MTPSPALTAAEVEALAELAKRAAVTFQAWRDSPTPEVWAASVKAEEDFRSSIEPSDVLGLLAALAERERERDEARAQRDECLNTRASDFSAATTDRLIAEFRADLAARERRVAELEKALRWYVATNNEADGERARAALAAEKEG